jgi:hypothetical protein
VKTHLQLNKIIIIIIIIIINKEMNNLVSHIEGSTQIMDVCKMGF